MIIRKFCRGEGGGDGVAARCEQEEQDAGDHKGPPNPTSSTLAPTDRSALCLAPRLRLMPIGGLNGWGCPFGIPSKIPVPEDVCWLSFTAVNEKLDEPNRFCYNESHESRERKDVPSSSIC